MTMISYAQYAGRPFYYPQLPNVITSFASSASKTLSTSPTSVPSVEPPSPKNKTMACD